MIHRRALAALTLSAAAAVAAVPAQATVVALAADGAWSPFSVDNFVGPSFGLGWIDDANGSPLTFTFAIAAGSLGTFTVVDAAFAGDTFTVTGLGAPGTTSAVPLGNFDTAPFVGLDYDAALADAGFSRGIFTLGEGSYSIGGSLLQSLLLGGDPLNATAGAVRLSVAAPIPEPETYALMLAGLGLAGFMARRRQR